ncbi:MAG: hypothetical protein U5K69_16295 [Balneolaceae bacterium]|nr:hypothetical protein [Balneolaceae bacterium]
MGTSDLNNEDQSQELEKPDPSKARFYESDYKLVPADEFDRYKRWADSQFDPQDLLTEAWA